MEAHTVSWDLAMGMREGDPEWVGRFVSDLGSMVLIISGSKFLCLVLLAIVQPPSSHMHCATLLLSFLAPLLLLAKRFGRKAEILADIDLL